MEGPLVACCEWLRQGDVFASVPCPDPLINRGRLVRWNVVEVPALLLTFDCQIDKPRATLLHFAPLRPISLLTVSDLGNARRDRLDPHDFLRIILDAESEAFCRPSETFWVPLENFGSWYWTENEDDEQVRVLPTVNRLGTLPADRLQLLRSKLNVFWTGMKPMVEPDAELFPQP